MPSLGREMTVYVGGIVDDSLKEDWILHEELPTEGEVAFSAVVMSRFIFGGLSMADKEDIEVLILHLIYKRIITLKIYSKIAHKKYIIIPCPFT